MQSAKSNKWIFSHIHTKLIFVRGIFFFFETTEFQFGITEGGGFFFCVLCHVKREKESRSSKNKCINS